MKFYEELMSLAQLQPDSLIKDAVLGWYYSYMELEDGRFSVCPSVFADIKGRFPLKEDGSPIIGSSPKKFLKFLLSFYITERIVALLATASLLPILEDEGLFFDPAELFAGKRVGLVGFEEGVADILAGYSKNLKIFDDHLSRKENVFPIWSSPHLISGCDIIVLSSVSLLDRAVLGILPVLKNFSGEVVVMGCCIPYVPKVYKDVGANYLAIVTFDDATLIKNSIKEGSSFKTLYKFARWYFKTL